MPRIARIVIPGCAHHVTQCGNNRQDIFFVDDDRRSYLRILREQAARFGLQVEAGRVGYDDHFPDLKLRDKDGLQ